MLDDTNFENEYSEVLDNLVEIIKDNDFTVNTDSQEIFDAYETAFWYDFADADDGDEKTKTKNYDVIFTAINLFKTRNS